MQKMGIFFRLKKLCLRELNRTKKDEMVRSKERKKSRVESCARQAPGRKIRRLGGPEGKSKEE
jgi:hypothetical protein